jgi:hypothetical protein
MIKKTVLIFPAGMPNSIAYLNKCKDENCEIIGSSSLAYDPSRDLYPLWVTLPYVTDPTFDDALKKIIDELHIQEIFTPNLVIWNYLNKNLHRLIDGVILANASPVDEGLAGYRGALQKARFLSKNQLSFIDQGIPHHMPSLIELAGLCRYADLVPGMCSDEKCHALLEIARHSVQGDLVEIGSWWGKSAFVFLWLAQQFKIGSLLCVDPWSNTHLVQNEKIVDSGSAQVDADEALDIFEIGLLPFNKNHINYLRMTSVEGAHCYEKQRTVNSIRFGETVYSGKIAILHIDGNHAHEAVKTDIQSWGLFVIDGGWIIFDDYLWPYGDGPKKVGDHFIEENQSRITTAFVMGGALFIQLGCSSPPAS